MRFIGSASGGSKPTTPTIGAATDDGTGTGVSVAFTPSTYIGKGTITYTATSSPGSLTASGAGSPLVVSGLTAGTAYTFTVTGTTNYGVTSDSSAASNSVTPIVPGDWDFITSSTSTASSVSFSSLPSGYSTFIIRVLNQTASAGTNWVAFYINNDTSSTYKYRYNYINKGASVNITLSGEQLSNSYNFMENAISNSPNALEVIINGVNDTSYNKTFNSRSISWRYAETGSGFNWFMQNVGTMTNTTAAITTITMVNGYTPSYAQYVIYGIK